MSGVVLMPEPVEAQLLGLVVLNVILILIVSVIIIALAIGVFVGGVGVLFSPLIIISLILAVITLPIWGVPFILFLFSVGVLGFIGVTALGLISIPILLIGGFVLQLVFGIPVFSILFSLLQMAGDLILTPLSLIEPLVSGISNFIQSIGKVETSEVINSEVIT